MNKITIILYAIFTFFYCNSTKCQTSTLRKSIYFQNIERFKKLEGIWIAENFHNSFSKTKSIIKSENSFDALDPVGIRIRVSDTNNKMLEIGVSKLHSHIFFPEETKYTIWNEDTISQDYYLIDLTKKDSAGFYRINTNLTDSSTIYLYNSDVEQPNLSILMQKTEFRNSLLIKYIQLEETSNINTKYPYPIYYYTRSQTLTGNYILYDSLNNIVSENFMIFNNGKSDGFELFEKTSFYFSTDIYCGPSSELDRILIFENPFDENGKYYIFAYNRIDSNTIEFCKIEYIKNEDPDLEGIDKEVKGKPVFTLKRK